MVQDHKDARFGEMPGSAIAHGTVDHVRPEEERRRRRARLNRQHVGAMAVLVAAVACGPWPATAACSGLDPVATEITVQTDRKPAPNILAAAQAEIRKRSDAFGRRASGDAVTRGLTVNKVETATGYTLATVTLPDGTACIALKNIQAQVSDRDLTVLIDSAYRPGSCQYQAVLDHERQHVRINAEALNETARLLRARLEAVRDEWGRRWLAEKETAEIETALSRAAEASVRSARADADAAHRRLDTPESYGAVQARCASW